MFEWDEAKRRRNLAKHGIDFDAVWEMEWAKAIHRPDIRQDYGEARYVALVPIAQLLCCCAYAERGGNRRIISVRPASRKEKEFYEEKTIDQ